MKGPAATALEELRARVARLEAELAAARTGLAEGGRGASSLPPGPPATSRQSITSARPEKVWQPGKGVGRAERIAGTRCATCGRPLALEDGRRGRLPRHCRACREQHGAKALHLRDWRTRRAQLAAAATADDASERKPGTA